MTTVNPLTFARKIECEEDGLYFNRYFFKQRMGSKMLIAPHHVAIQKTLDQVISGEITRLIVNIPPGYSKTEMATINTICRGLALNPRARFLHLSYSHNLALLNSSTARGVVKSKEYQAMWPMALKEDADSKAMWWTDGGGGVYASSAAGQVTGFRAGHMQPGWQGCFPPGTMIDTEQGSMAIDDIVSSKKQIRVKSFNHETGETELQPVIGWWKNPSNSIVEVGLSDGSVFRCTPCHKIYTENRGYVRADSLASSDVLPARSSYALECANGNSEDFSNLGTTFSGIEKNFVWNVANPLTSLFVKTGFKPIRDRSPSLAQLDLANDANPNTVSLGQYSASFIAGEYLDNLFSVKLRPWSSFKEREGSVPNGVRHVLRLGSPRKIVKPVIYGVAIKVSPLLLGGFWTYKGFQNKLMDVFANDLTAFGKANVKVSMPVGLGFKSLSGEGVATATSWVNGSVDASHVSKVANLVGPLVSSGRNPIFIKHVGHVDSTYCLTVRGNSNFILSSCQVLVHNCLLIDDPVKPDDAFSETVRGGVNNRFNETIKSRLALETTPMVVIMQRIHYDDLSGYLLRGGSGEKWHHLNLPVIIDNSEAYPEENTHGIQVDHGLPDGWLWPIKHNEAHRVSLTSHRRTFEAQYMQKPRKFNAEGALWNEGLISAAHAMVIRYDKVRTVVAVDPATTSSDESDETGIVVASSYGGGDTKQYSVDGDYSGRYSPAGWATKAMHAYNEHKADAIVIETNQGGDMAESTLKNSGYKGRIVKVHASKGKFARAEPIAALYEQGRVSHTGSLYTLENQIMEYVPATSKKSPDRLDAMVYALTELGIGSYSWSGF